jgi:glycosyltransferase involved in cell wall biosynthesis
MKDIVKNVAFVSTGRDIGGVTAYVGRLLTGLKKIGHDGKLVFITRGTGKPIADAYRRFGNHEYILAKNTEQIVNILNSFDLVVHEMPGGFDDHRHFKTYGNTTLPWFYDGLYKVTAPQTALLLDTGTLTKWCPYIDKFEEFCKYFISIKTGLSNLYDEMRGNVDVYTVDVPISVDETDLSRFGKRNNLIVSTNRLYAEKRLHFLIDAMHFLPNWRAELHTGRYYYFYAKKIEEIMAQNTIWYKNLDINYDVYYDAALTYAASYLGNGSDGGMECVSMEGAVRGAVPLITDNWVAPHLDSPAEDIVYKFSIKDGKTNLLDVISNIDPQSSDYLRRQQEIFEYVKTFKRDTVQAKKLLWLMKYA